MILVDFFSNLSEHNSNIFDCISNNKSLHSIHDECNDLECLFLRSASRYMAIVRPCNYVIDIKYGSFDHQMFVEFESYVIKYLSQLIITNIDIFKSHMNRSLLNMFCLVSLDNSDYRSDTLCQITYSLYNNRVHVMPIDMKLMCKDFSKHRIF